MDTVQTTFVIASSSTSMSEEINTKIQEALATASNGNVQRL